jgi:Uma2 family endonuclease
MSLEDYLALPDQPKAEWVDGWTIIVSPTRGTHGRPHARIVAALVRALPDAEVLVESGLRMSHAYRVPDIMVYAPGGDLDVVWFDTPPLVAVEVLSPGTGRYALIDKAAEYAVHGVGQYWIADPDMRSITVWTNENAAWRTTATLDDGTPRIKVAVGDLGAVALEQTTIFGPPPP